MTDRELLEAAARAAGIKWDRRDECWYGNPPVRPDWNPLTDDGDALRLAVKLGLRVQANRRAAIASGNHGTTSEKIMNDDPYAATRRAIVRAAAKMGEPG